MATKRTAATKASGTKRTKSADSGNGAKETSGRTRVPDKLEGLSEAKRRNIAKLITRERSKSPATSWPKIIEMVEDKYDWTLPGSMTGRRLMRDYGPDGAEDAIIKQNRTAKAKTAKKVAAKKGASKKKVQEVEEPEDLEELEEDEELDEELDEEDEEELSADEDEDEDEDEEDEEEDEPVPAPKSKKVRVTKGRTRKSNPSS